MEDVFVTSVDSLGSVDVDSLPIQILDLGLDRTGVGPTWKSIFPIGFQTFTMRIRIFQDWCRTVIEIESPIKDSEFRTLTPFGLYNIIKWSYRGRTTCRHQHCTGNPLA